MTAVVAARSRWHRLVERLLPWYDPKAEEVRNARTEEVRLRAIAARIGAEKVRADYLQAATVLERSRR